MSEFSEWQELLDFSTKSANKKGRLAEFSQIANDNVKRVEFFMNDANSRELLHQWMDHRLKREQSPGVAKQWREVGNKKFSERDYPAAVEAYTSGILSCPEHGGEELSLVLANRSAALFFLALYEDCLCDINKALENNYPERLLPKLFVRKAKCLKHLAKQADYQDELKALREAVEKLKLSVDVQGEIDTICQQIPHAPEKFTKDSEGQSCGGQDVVPELYGGEHPSVKGASSALSIQYSTGKGRYVIASQNIKAGHTLFVEEPNALVVLPDFQQSRCHHCTKADGRTHPCLNCGQVWFCSRSCRQQAASSYHSFECGLLAVLHSVGVAHLGLRIVLSYGLQELLAFSSDTEAHTMLPGLGPIAYDTASYPVMYHLVSHTERLAPEEIYQYAMTAAFLTLLLERYTSFFQSSPTGTVATVGGLVLVHICQMVGNAHAITELCDVDENGERQERVATAIYPAASLMNHSCDPSVINSFQGSRLIVRAIKDVPAGGEIFNCYGPHYRRMSRKERQEMLQAQYLFTCECPPCQDVHTDDFQDFLYSFQCSSCQGSLVNPKSGRDQMSFCRSCQTPQSYFTQLKDDLEAVSLDTRGTDAMNKGDIVQAVKLLTKCVQLRSKALFRGHPDLGRSADKLAQCYAFLGNYGDCERMLRISLQTVEHQYGRYSIEMANELQKYTDVLMELVQAGRAETDELVRYLKEASFIYDIHYGQWSKNYKEVSLKMDRLASLTSSK